MNAEPINAVLQHVRRQAAAEAAAHLSDAQLLARFQGGDQEDAFAVLLHRHGPMVWRVCRRVLSHRHDAEDVFQATFLTLVRKAGAIRKHASLAAWLHGVAFRLASRVRARRGRTVNSPLAPAEPAPDLAEQAGGKEERAAFDEELARLPDEYRLPLVLCYLEGKTRDEAAEQLGWSLSKLKRRLDSGRKLLAGRLTRRGVELGSALIGVSLAQESVLSAVPSVLAAGTCAAAVRLAAGAAVGEVLSAQVALLVESMTEAAAAGKLKLAALVMVAVVALAGGVGLAFARSGEDPSASAAQPAPAPQVAAPEQAPPPPPPKVEEPPPAKADPPRAPRVVRREREEEDEDEDRGERQKRRSRESEDRSSPSAGRSRKREEEDDRREGARSSSRKKKPDGKQRSKDD